MAATGHVKRILVVDDDVLMNDFLKEILTRRGYKVEQTYDGQSAISLIEAKPYDLVLTDKKMPDCGGLEVLEAAATGKHPTRAILMTAYGSMDEAADAMRLGAFDYIMKPFDADQIEDLIERALEESSRKEPRVEASPLIAGTSEKMREVYELMRVVAPTSSTVLVSGESGTGKELVAREIQRLSKRCDKPFVRLNCAALPDSLIESELFGHERGAFTGALQARIGRFEMADGGTLLLDEIGEIGVHMQAKILRVLQEKEFERIGSQRTRTADVRVIATTNKNLTREIECGRFREDLYYRLNVFPIALPPLRDRREDIPELVHHFIHKYRELCDSRIIGIEDDALAMLVGHHWPGNVRELENCIERALIVGDGPNITKRDLVPPAPVVRGDVTTLDAGTSVREMEKILVLKTLESVGWNRTMAAQKLGISTRTLRNKIKIYRAEDISAGTEKSSHQLDWEPQTVCTPRGCNHFGEDRLRHA
jgi:DNA-binding NtrC family response regulator